jgi:hypothetical protein
LYREGERGRGGLLISESSHGATEVVDLIREVEKSQGRLRRLRQQLLRKRDGGTGSGGLLDSALNLLLLSRLWGGGGSPGSSNRRKSVGGSVVVERMHLLWLLGSRACDGSLPTTSPTVQRDLVPGRGCERDRGREADRMCLGLNQE